MSHYSESIGPAYVPTLGLDDDGDDDRRRREASYFSFEMEPGGFKHLTSFLVRK